ncbi:hypothetical protein Q8F55_008512 [Vanrija albida]|uniref:Amino acid transporter transmembrane domain-containing protein n=1 Tax=Vanrija albida TaxID=181172 RepID=A0ABR3PR11_9TREE
MTTPPIYTTSTSARGIRLDEYPPSARSSHHAVSHKASSAKNAPYDDAEVGPAKGVGRGEGGQDDEPLFDAVFGEISDKGPNYRAVGTLGAFVLITKANLGLGVLSIPFVFMTLGIVPGVIVILVVQTMIGYCAAAIGPFKRNHPEVYGLADAGYVFGGVWAKEYLYGVFSVNLIMIISSAIVSISVALNAISVHGACTAIFVAVAAVAGCFMGSFRTLNKITWFGWVGLAFLIASVLTLTVAVGVQDRPAAAPPTGAWDKDIKVVAKPNFAAAMGAVNAVMFSYGATPTYFNIISEMRDPRGYTTAMASSIGLMTVVYLVIGNVVYHFTGQYVSSPSLGSAGPLMKKVCYGIALPALFASLTIVTHIQSKHVFVRILSSPSRQRHLVSNSWTHWLTWCATLVGSSLIAYVIASAVPNFGSIISLIGALIVPSAAIIPYPLMWWHDNWRFRTSDERREPKRQLAFVVNLIIVAVGIFITGAGTYSAVMDIMASTAAGAGPWTCADNSNSVPKPE